MTDNQPSPVRPHPLNGFFFCRCGHGQHTGRCPGWVMVGTHLQAPCPCVAFDPDPDPR